MVTCHCVGFSFVVKHIFDRLIASGTANTLVKHLATVNDYMPDDYKSDNLNDDRTKDVSKVGKNVASMLKCLNLAMENSSKDENKKLMKSLVDMKAHDIILGSLKNCENNATIGQNATNLLLTMSEYDKNVLIDLQSKNIVSALSKTMAFNPNNSKLTAKGSAALEVFSDTSILVDALKLIQEAADNKWPSETEKEAELLRVESS